MACGMRDLNCPTCNADIEPDLLERTGKAECPFCGADVSHLSVKPLGAVEPRPANRLESRADGQKTPSESETSSTSSLDLPPLPAGSQIQVIEASTNRLIFQLPAGGKQVMRNGWEVFRFIVSLCLFTPMFLFGLAQQGAAGLELALLLTTLAFFWFFGLRKLHFWIKTRFERMFLLIDRQTIAIKTTLFGNKRIQEFILTPTSQATLETSADGHVYDVAVSVANDTVKFGRLLSNDEKDWLVDCINEHLREAERRNTVAAVSSAPSAPSAEIISPSGSTDGACVVPQLPADTMVQTIEATPDRLVLGISGGGKQAANLGWFVLVVNVFMCVFTSLMLSQGVPEWPISLGVIVMLSLLWAAGLGMFWFWIRMRFERTTVVLSRQSIAVHRILFGMRRFREFVLTPESKATLAMANYQNDASRYQVAISGANGTVKFGTALSDADKKWLVDRINLQLGKTASSATAPELSAVSAQRIRADSIPRGDLITIQESQSDHLRFRIPVAQNGSPRWVVSSFLCTLGLVCMSLVSGSAVQQLRIGAGPFEWSVLLIPFLFFGVTPMLASAFVLFGTITVDLTRERLRCKWGIGNWGYARTVPTASIENVVASKNVETNRPQNAPGTDFPIPVACIVQAGGKRLHLTLFHSPDVIVHVAALVRTKLEDIGFVVHDA